MKSKLKFPNFRLPLILPFISLLITFILLIPKITIAQQPSFAISEELIYQVSDSGNTLVTQNVSLTNLTSDFFPREYLIHVNNFQISNLKAADPSGPLELQSSDTDKGHDIRLKFNDKILGLGKILRFTLTYETGEIAQKEGKFWEITIPPVPKPAGLTKLAVRLVVPESFGQKILSRPEVKTTDFFWTGDDLKSSPAKLFFGPPAKQLYQVINFNLKYHLYNSRLYPVSAKIALPSDSPYQKVFLNNLSPKGANVILDKDGNWLAQYPLGPLEKTEVNASGSVAIFAEPRTPPLSLENPENLLKPQKFWPSADPSIQQIAKTLGSPEEVYNYVESFLTYTPQGAKNPRGGGLGSLLSPQKAGPQDFSDLFVTLARSAGIASREVYGYLISKNSGRHIWPEYFDNIKKQWVMVDPALSSLSSGLDYFHTLDMNHVAIFTQSADESPTLPDETAFTPTTSDLNLETVPKTIVSANLPRQITAGFAATGQLFVENPGPTLFPGVALSLKPRYLTIQNPVLLTGDIPPFGHQDLTVKILPESWNSEFNDIITINSGYDRNEYPVKVVPLYKNGYLFLFGGATILGILSIFAQITRSLFLQKFSRGDNLRRKS